MGEDFAGQKRQQDMFQYSMAGSLAAALLSGWYFQSIRTGWQVYLAGLFFTWLINIVEWSYWFTEHKSWVEGKFLDATGFWELERMEALIYAAAKQQQHQITLNGGPARMTISATAIGSAQIQEMVMRSFNNSFQLIIMFLIDRSFFYRFIVTAVSVFIIIMSTSL